MAVRREIHEPHRSVKSDHGGHRGDRVEPHPAIPELPARLHGTLRQDPAHPSRPELGAHVNALHLVGVVVDGSYADSSRAIALDPREKERTRAVVASTPGLEGVLASDWRRTSRFYERFGVTEGLLRHGAPKSEMDGEGSDMADGLAPHGSHHESVACLEHSTPSASAFLDLE